MVNQKANILDQGEIVAIWLILKGKQKNFKHDFTDEDIVKNYWNGCTNGWAGASPRDLLLYVDNPPKSCDKSCIITNLVLRPLNLGKFWENIGKY